MAEGKKLQKLIRDLGSDYLGVRLCACDTLTTIGKPAVSALINALKDENEVVRSRAAEGLGKICDPKAVPALLEALKDEKMYVQGCVALALNEIAGSMMNKGDYASALKIIKDTTTTVMEFYSTKDSDSLKKRREKLAELSLFTQQIYNKMNPDKKKFHKPVEHQTVRTVRKKVRTNG